jgi:Fe-S-cluster containining protein
MSSIENNGQKNDIGRLERQIERGSFFTHTALSENAALLTELQSFTFGLIDTLIQRGIITEEEVTQAVDKVRKQMEANGEVDIPRIALRIDRKRNEEDIFSPVDCAERIQTCKGICCKLSFALSRAEIEEGWVKWDLGRPYFIRQEKDGYCTHHDVETHRCGIYENRPDVCRGYICANDHRIWKDFQKIDLNREWLDANLSGAIEPRMEAFMHGIECFAGVQEIEKQEPVKVPPG